MNEPFPYKPHDRLKKRETMATIIVDERIGILSFNLTSLASN